MDRQVDTTLTAAAPQIRQQPIERWAFPAVVAVALLAALSLPVLAAIISLLGIAAYSKRPALVGGVTVGVVALILAWLNTGKIIQGDWAWYVLHYQVLSYTPLSEYLGIRIGPVSSEFTEPLYYAMARAISLATDGNVAILALAVTLVIYGVLGAALALSISSVDRRPWTVIVATATGMLVGLTFTLTTQLVRQEIAAALIALAIVASAKHKWMLSASILIVAALTHNSALIPAAGLVLATLLRGNGKVGLPRFVLGGVIFYALGRFYLSTTGNASYTGKNDGSISMTVVAFDLLVVATFFFLYKKDGLYDNRIASTVLMCTPAFYGFVLGVASQPLPLLRMYFFVEILRALMIVFICGRLMRGRLRIIIGVALLLAAIAYIVLRIQQSPFVYEASLVNTLLWTPLAGFLSL